MGQCGYGKGEKMVEYYNYENHSLIPRKTAVEEVIDYLYSPGKILENMILALIEASGKNKEKVKELHFVLRFARAFSKES